MAEITIESLQEEIQELKIELREANDKVEELEKDNESMREGFRDIEHIANRLS